MIIKGYIKDNVKWYFKHKREKDRAKKALQTIEGYRGKTEAKLIKLSNAYAQEVLGNKVCAPWLQVYSALQNEFKEGWIVDNYYKKEVVPKQREIQLMEWNALNNGITLSETTMRPCFKGLNWGNISKQ